VRVTIRNLGLAVIVCCSVSSAQAGDLTVEESGVSPDKKITVTSPGVYKAVLWQESGGGINEFYDLAADPEASHNLVGTGASVRGLVEIGWHGRPFKGEGEACCAEHISDPKKKENGKSCYDGCMDWPSAGHKKLGVRSELAVTEKSAARVRVSGRGTFTWWAKYSNEKDAAVTPLYTFYPAGQIILQVRVQMIGQRTLHWGPEYGPHLLLPFNAKDGKNFSYSTPTVDKVTKSLPKSEELVLGTSAAVKSAVLLTIPAEAQALFDRHLLHMRFGYGSNKIDMPPGYDHTWACLVQLGTQGHDLLPPLRTAKDALPFATQYRVPAKIDGAELVKDAPGDFNKDGFNESEGCHVLKGPGPLAFTYERGAGAGFAPAFRIVGWNGPAAPSAKVDGKEVPSAAAVVDGNLIVQMLGTIAAPKAKIEIGR